MLFKPTSLTEKHSQDTFSRINKLSVDSNEGVGINWKCTNSCLALLKLTGLVTKVV